jgi:hypothetical protein
MDAYDDRAALRPVRRRRPRRLSEVFLVLAAEARGPVSVAAIRDALGDRSFAALLVIFSALNLLPLPPGTSVVLGIPIVIVAAQMVLGRRTAWLPARLLAKSIPLDRFRAGSDRIVPLLQRLERLVRPRYWPFWRHQGDRVIGVIALVLGIAVVLPVPLGNWLPAFASTLVGLALSERDGILFAIATAVGIASLVIIVAVVASAGAVLTLLWKTAGLHHWF